MSINEETLFKTMLSTLITKYGLSLTTKECSNVLGISSRTLDERRKSGMNCPEYIEENSKSITYPVQNIIIFQIEKSKKQSIQIIN